MTTGMSNLERIAGSPIPENSSIWGVWTAPAERITSLEHDTLCRARLPSVKNWTCQSCLYLHWQGYIPRRRWSTGPTNYPLNGHYVVRLRGCVWHVDGLLHAGSDVCWSQCRNNLLVRKISFGCLDWANQGSTCLQLLFHYLDQSRWGFLIRASRQERVLSSISWAMKDIWRTYVIDCRSILGS